MFFMNFNDPLDNYNAINVINALITQKPKTKLKISSIF